MSAAARNNCATQFDGVSPGVTNFKMGAPGVETLSKCTEILKKATIHRMDEPNAHQLFQYGPESGDRQFLETLASFLTEEYQSPVQADDMIVTAGATQALNVLTHLLFSNGDLVFMEDPTYFLSIRMLESEHGMKYASVPVDDEGIVPSELEKVLQAHQDYRPRELTERKPFWAMLYLIPVYHNPTGVCLSPDRCREVIKLARKYNLLVLCDDVYNLLHFPDKTAPQRLFTYDDKSDPEYQGNVVSNGTFSKIFGPGIRLGWMELPDRVKDIIITSGMARSGGGFNHTMSGVMTSVISLGLLTNLLKESRKDYQAQCEALCGVLKKKLPTASFKEPSGGYFLWVKLPDGIQAPELLKRCEADAQLTFVTGHVTSPTGKFIDHVRLSFSYYDKDVLAVGAERLMGVLDKIRAGQ